MAFTFEIKNRDPSIRRPPRRRCIYCDKDHYRQKDDRKLGDEHIVAESLGGNLVLEQAACEACEKQINSFEQPILKTVLYAPRVHLGIRRKRRKRGEETLKVHGKVNGKEVALVLPVKNVPVLLFFVRLGPPGILVDRPSTISDMRGAWALHLSSGPVLPHGFESFSSPILDTFKFTQFLAKMAHCFARDQLGDGFNPLLLEVIQSEAKSQRYDLIGGRPEDSPASDNLHELELYWQQVNTNSYAVVKIRLFANLGAPTYLVVAGEAKAS